MPDAFEVVKCLLFAVGAAILFYRYREIAQAIETFRDNFPRGGPRTPMHPSVAADSALLRRKSRGNATA